MRCPTIVWLTAAGACLAQGEEPFIPVLPVDVEDEPWGGGVEPAAGPERDGQPTVALRWPVDRRPGPDSPVLCRGFDDVAAIRFWLWIDRPRDYRINVLLTGTRHYFNTAVPLDWTGWRQLTIPIDQFSPVREAVLSDMQRLSFRMQGYGQPALDPDMVWWVDQIELQPRPGARLPLSNSIEANLAAWRELAAGGSPYGALLARRYERPLPAFSPPESITSTWQYRGVAETLAPVAYMAGDAASPYRGRHDLVAYGLAAVDWLVAECSEEGWWFRGSPQVGDPNVNRFTLGPLLDAVRWLRMLPEGEAAWPRWAARLDVAIDLQRRAYRGEVDWDWGGKAAGEYANQDAYYVLIMALSALLYDRPLDQTLAAEMMVRIAENLLPDGGISYIGVENEAPVYHALNLVILGRYATLTGDPVARRLLADTAPYWPLVLTAEGQPEYWSDVWWKQTWGYVWPEAVVIAAGATGEARNRALMWQVLARTSPSDGGWAGVCSLPYWPGNEPGEELPERFVVADRNAGGLRGRDGQWYFGVALGRGLRNTFAGGLITSATHTRPLLAAIRGLHIDVLQDPRRDKGLWLSQLQDRGGLALRPDRSAALGVRYRLQPSLINGWPTPETPDTPWQVTQTWRAAGDGLLGQIAVEALADAPGIAVEGRVAVGPRTPALGEDGLWHCGPLRIKLFETFGDVEVKPIPGYATTTGWDGIVMRQALANPSPPGTRYRYAVWLGPSDRVPPDRCEPLADDLGWVAAWPDGRRAAVLFNPGQEAVVAAVPWLGEAAAWSAEGAPVPVTAGDGQVRLTVPPGACILVEP